MRKEHTFVICAYEKSQYLETCRKYGITYLVNQGESGIETNGWYVEIFC